MFEEHQEIVAMKCRLESIYSRGVELYLDGKLMSDELRVRIGARVAALKEKGVELTEQEIAELQKHNRNTNQKERS